MRRIRLIAVALLLTSAAGCAAVVVESPMGDRPVHLESGRWEGTWLHSDGAVRIRIQDAEAGILRVAWLEGDAAIPALESTAVYLRRAGERIVVSVPEPDAVEPRYLWGLVVGGDDEIIVFMPATERFRQLVEEGSLPGSIHGDVVSLGALGSEQLRLIVEHERGFPFELDEPLVLRRVAP